MASLISLQFSSIVPEGKYAMAAANVGGKWLPEALPVLRAVGSSSAEITDFIRVSEGGPYTIIPSGVETKQFDSRIELWSPGWTGLANYNWWFADQNTAVATLWTMDITVWHPSNAQEIVYWFCVGGLAVRTAIRQKAVGRGSEWYIPEATTATSEALPSHAVSENERAQWFGKLEDLSKLPTGWDRHGAPAPSHKALLAARQFIRVLIDDGQPPTRVAASAVGGVGVTRQVGARMAYLEFYNDGTACALLADDAGYERVLDVTLEERAARNLLDEVKAYLNG